MEESVQEATTFQRKTLAEAEEKSIEELKTKGVSIIQPDRAAFEEATKNVAKTLSDNVPEDLIEEIKAAAK
nr:hypothetical protein [Metabacillus idriensis]